MMIDSDDVFTRDFFGFYRQQAASSRLMIVFE